MRLVQLNPFFFPYAGGTERRILELGRRLAARHHEVHVVTARLDGTNPQEEWRGLTIHRLDSRFRLAKLWNPPLVKTPGVVDELRRIRPDVVDFHYRWSPNYHRAFVRSGRFSRRCFTYNNTFGEGTGVLRPPSEVNDRLTARWIKRSDRIVAVSSFIRDDLLAHGFPGDRLVVVPNGVDPDALRREADKGAIPPYLQGRRWIAAVGRLVPIKGFDVAIRALARLPADLHLIVAGHGPEQGKLQRLAQRLGLGARVHLPGWLPEPEKLRIVRDAAAFVHPARHEAFGIAPLEAMALGTPVVASRVGGLAELVGDAERLVPPKDPGALAAALARVLEDVQARRSAAQSGTQRADTYTWEAASRRLETVYEELLHAPLHPPPRQPT